MSVAANYCFSTPMINQSKALANPHLMIVHRKIWETEQELDISQEMENWLKRQGLVEAGLYCYRGETADLMQPDDVIAFLKSWGLLHQPQLDPLLKKFFENEKT